MKKAQGGFTLIELVVVMVILGILAAVALPKFVDMGSQARTAKMNGAIGAVKSASALVHAKYLAQGSTGAVVIEGNSTGLTLVNGYPSATDMITAAGLDSTFTTSTAGTAPAVLTVKESSSTTTCLFIYTEATTTAAASVGTLGSC